jgi:two-component system, response regulator / RNA-binding antiterminator
VLAPEPRTGYPVSQCSIGGGNLRIAVIDDSSARAAVIAEGLREAGLEDIAVLTERGSLIARLVALSPDVVLLNLANASRDALEESFLISRSLNRPIAMFVDQSDEETTKAAVDAGVSAYVVDGFRKERVKPILDLAIRRFQAFSKLQAELAEARSQLAERRAVDEAKRLLMRRRRISEPEAYRLLRTHAMESSRRISDVAESIVAAERLLGGEV